LSEAEQARRTALLEGDRIREALAASLAEAELTSADFTSNDNSEDDVECPPLESRRASWDWEVRSQHNGSQSDDDEVEVDSRSRRQRLEEELELREEDVHRISQYMQYVDNITRRRTHMLSGMTTLPHAPVGFRYIEDDEYVLTAHTFFDSNMLDPEDPSFSLKLKKTAPWDRQFT
jgi:hypothetical protein